MLVTAAAVPFLISWLVTAAPEPATVAPPGTPEAVPPASVCAPPNMCPPPDDAQPLAAVSSPVLVAATENGVTLWAPTEINDGKLLVVELIAPASCPDPVVTWQKMQFITYPTTTGRRQSLLPVALALKAGPQKIAVGCGKDETLFYVRVIHGVYPESKLTVDPRFNEAPPPRAGPEAAAIHVAFATSSPSRLWSQQFLRPGTGEETSPFGVRRTYNGQLKGHHFGLDFDGKVGDPVWASNDGVVVLASDDFFFVGNAVFIDHGDHLFTMYFHMSKLMVKTGDTVIRGQQLGLVGGTGRVTGPHIHFAVKYAGVYIDPVDWLNFRPAFETVKPEAKAAKVISR